jgi:hypothetical protein
MTATTTQQIRIARRSPAYWRITFDIPPLNIFGPETIPQLQDVVRAIENDAHLRGCCLRQRCRRILPYPLQFLRQAPGYDCPPPRPNRAPTVP